jgi:hypothetical protein
MLRKYEGGGVPSSIVCAPGFKKIHPLVQKLLGWQVYTHNPVFLMKYDHN